MRRGQRGEGDLWRRLLGSWQRRYLLPSLLIKRHRGGLRRGTAEPRRSHPVLDVTAPLPKPFRFSGPSSPSFLPRSLFARRQIQEMATLPKHPGGGCRAGRQGR